VNRTVRLELPNAARRASVAGQVVLALAITCGTGPLAGERLRRSVEAVAAIAAGSLVIDAVADRGSLDLLLAASPDEGWADQAASLLEHHGAVRTPGGVRVQVQRTALFRVADV
jgi:predicted TPR repeat methyltransferase